MSRWKACFIAATLIFVGADGARLWAAAHPMPYRIIWTWDSWICDPNNPRSYVDEYEKLIDFMAQHDYNALIIWGFLDDKHGGTPAAQEIAHYARLKGIKILPGVGAGGYNGFDQTPGIGHPYNLPTFLQQNPSLEAVTRWNHQTASDILCLYQPGSLTWLQNASAWLAANFEIGGVNVETNEAGNIDVCTYSSTATAQEPNRLNYATSFSDLNQAVPVISNAINPSIPGAWITYATYAPPWWNRTEDAWLLKKLPAASVAQWNINQETNSSNVAAPIANNYANTSGFGGVSYHLGAFPIAWAFSQYRAFYPNLAEARRLATALSSSGMSGFSVGAAGAPVMPDNEINYIALMEFTRNASLTVDQFSQQFIAPLYGSAAEPTVKQLMLNQPAVQLAAEATWRPWASLIYLRDRNAPLRAASASDLQGVQNQITLAQSALAAASPEGQTRLNAIIGVLNEYATLLALSRDSSMSTLISQHSTLTDAQLNTEMQKVVSFVSARGLPDNIYHYSYWGTGKYWNSLPTVSLQSPANNSTFAAGTAITFRGSGSDAEDGTLSGNSLIWSSTINGEIGRGGTVTVSTLSPGVHTITLTAVDSWGDAAWAAIKVTITSSNTTPPASPKNLRMR